MRLVSLLVLTLGCSGTKGDDSSPVESDADTDADADTDTDTDTTPEGATVTGSIVGYDAATPADVDVQFCQTTCYTTSTDATGTFTFTGMPAGSYKLDGVGEVLEGWDYGRIRMHVDLGADDVTVAEPLFLPRMLGPATVGSGVYTWGTVTIGLDVANLTVPFGYDEDQFWVGTVEGGDIPGFWGVTPSFAIAFLPLATEVGAPFTLSANAGIAAGAYDVYSVAEHGELEGPVGSCVVGEDGAIPNTTVQPSMLTWLLFVPA